jgi:hypothetical protein
MRACLPGRESDMTAEKPQPAECRLIHDMRESKLPRMSVRAAARRARLIPGATGWSEGSWRRYEGGGAPSIPADKLAVMALVVEALPEDLEQISRPDAATALRWLMQQQAARPEVPDSLRDAALEESGDGLDGLLAEIVQGLADIDSSDQLTRKQKAELRAELIAGIVRDVAERRGQVRAVLQIALPRK